MTAKPQPDNPTPWLFRLVDDRALVNRMGFNSTMPAQRQPPTCGLAAVVEMLVVGVNIGKTNAFPENEVAAEYVASAKLLADVAE